MRYAVERHQIHAKYALVAVNQIISHAADFPLSKAGEADGLEPSGEVNHRNFVKDNPGRSGIPFSGKNMNIKPWGQAFTELKRHILRASDATVSRNDDGNRRAMPSG
jgi:hypothetical protein